MQKLWCLSFENFKETALSDNWDKNVPDNIAIISIVNTVIDEDEIYHICNGENVLNLDFDDADPLANGLSDDIETFVLEDGSVIHFFTSSMAKQVVNFIEKHKDKDFYIHCAAGISRSQAFVKYIKNVYYDNDFYTNPNNPCVHPNGYVFQKLMQAYRSR
jgi:predicted protein tyrosine phosphatase